jgi:hypothetical protein
MYLPRETFTMWAESNDRMYVLGIELSTNLP